MTESDSNILSVRNVTKRYQSAGKPLVVLDSVSLSVQKGDSVAIVGPSGSGKTTLLGLCAGLDVPSEGDVTLAGESFGEMTEDERARHRNKHVGFVFQNFQLIPTFTALENVMVPLELRGEEAEEKARALLKEVGLSNRENHYPMQLSGGEQQRVALARAFINDPVLLFADEPTGNLDGANGEHVTELLLTLNRSKGTTLVLVTHDLELARLMHRTIHIRSGRIEEGASA